MRKPLDEFGGWLKCFPVLCWIILIVGIIDVIFPLMVFINAIIVAAAGLTVDPFVQHLGMFGLLKSILTLPNIIFPVLINRSLKAKSVDTPNKIMKIFGIYSLSIILVTVFTDTIVYPYYRPKMQLMQPSTTDQLQDILRTVIEIVIFYIVWFLYFKNSKRVLAYYGKNAG